MSIDSLNDYKTHKAVPGETIEKYRGLIPAEIMEIWEKFGFSSFCGGYLKTIDPDDYREIIDDSYFAGGESVPVFVTGFGDIVTWQDNKYIAVVKYRKHDAEILSSGFGFFLSDLADKDPELVERLEMASYDSAVAKHGELEYDECFGHAPLPASGGGESPDSVRKMKIKPHIEMMARLIGRIE